MTSIVQASSAIPELLRLSLNSGGSGRGMTFWSGAAVCGKQALLYEERAALWSSNPSLIPEFDLTRKAAFAVGGAYHKLHELWRKDLLPITTFDFNEPIEDASVALAIHLFRAYQTHTPKDFWGKPIATEVTLPASEWARRTMEELFGEVINAKPDHVVYLSREDLPRIQERCPTVTNPGYYIIDFKTEGSDYEEDYYLEGLQSYWYPFAWDLDNPEMPVEGIIFDILKKPDARKKDQSIGPDNFRALFAPVRAREYVLDTIKGLIKQGRANMRRARDENLGNRAACFKIGFGKLERCPFLNRECEGH